MELERFYFQAISNYIWLHYSYMELEPIEFAKEGHNLILLHYSYMELEPSSIHL